MTRIAKRLNRNPAHWKLFNFSPIKIAKITVKPTDIFCTMVASDSPFKATAFPKALNPATNKTPIKAAESPEPNFVKLKTSKPTWIIPIKEQTR